MAFCLSKENAEKFLAALRSGKILPEKLIEMTSEERRDFLEPIVGKADVREVNALLESKLLLKDQKRGMVSWAKKVAGISEARRADMIAKIEKLDRVLDAKDHDSFFEDLAAQKLGTEVSFEEAKNIAAMSKVLQESRQKWNGDKWTTPEAGYEYGAARVALTNYVNDLKLENQNVSVKSLAQEFKTNPVEATKENAMRIAGITKGLKASFDLSALFRQGWKTIFTHPDIWAKNSVQAFRDFINQAKVKPSNNDVLDATLAGILSRKRSMTGDYDRMKLDVGTNEEAYPSALPEKFPVLGRLYKASETAYKTYLYNMRADIADKYLDIAENNGVDIKDPKQAQSIGKLVNSLTGRGTLGKGEQAGQVVNAFLFSPKSLKANWDFLTAHQLQKDVSPFVRKQAAINLLRVVAGTAVILGTAQAVLGKDAVEWDPRSSDYGKIKIGDTRFDVSGGSASLITLAGRLIGRSTKSPTTHKITPLNAKNKDGSPKFGAKTGMDVAVDFATNKASPLASVAIDTLLRDSTFDGKKPTALNEGANLFVPLPITNAQEVLADPHGANALLTIIADGLGIATNTYKPN